MSGRSFYAPDYSIRIEGLTLGADVRNAVQSVVYDNNIDTADMFTVKLSNAGLRFTDSALFDVGKNVEIHLGYSGELVPMMLGEITAISPSFPAGGAPTLTLTGYDKSHRMRHNSPPGKSFKYLDDSLVAAQIATENLLVPVVDPTFRFNEQIDQNGSDWALLQELADRNYFQVFVHWDKLYFRFPRPQVEMTVLEWGKNLSSFSPKLSTAGQRGVQVVRSYNYKLAQAIVSVLPAVALDADLEDVIERLGTEFLSQLVQLGRHVLRGKSVTDDLDAKRIAKATLLQILNGLYEANGTCIGIPELRAGEMIEVRGLGKRFSGRYRLSKVTHSIDESGYRTSFEVSQRYNGNFLQSLRKKLNDSDPPNKQKEAQGVAVGVVRNNRDPEGLGRVKVSFREYPEVNESQWARVATFLAGGGETKSWGGYFLPDIDDEVLVAFENGDFNRPVIVGSLWHGKARPPETNREPDSKNARKLIRTRTGMQILFDETRGRERLDIRDAVGNTIALDSKKDAESITVKDKAGATIALESKEGEERILLTDKAGSTIEMDSATGDIVIEAKGNVIIKSGPSGKIDLNP